jgi:2-polyprenyl-3-methyl-5-hydroxy-6-metoxy-1,4-benzoquinol methylase
MKANYSRYYQRYSSVAPFVFLWHAILTKKLRKLSLINRQKDYLRLANNPQLLALHDSLNQHLLEGIQLWKSYDYGEGYFYQSFQKIGISGFRDTQARIETMGLPELLKDRRVLEIGSNAGFLTLSVANYCSYIIGVEPAGHLVSIAKDTAAFLGVNNCEFRNSSFEEFSSATRFDTVLSFANHSTYDGNSTQSIKVYIDHCAALLCEGGMLLFESHPPEHEGEGLKTVIEEIARNFTIECSNILQYGSFLDRNRTFIVARRN